MDYYSFTDPEGMEGWLTHSGHFTHKVGPMSTTDQALICDHFVGIRRRSGNVRRPND